MVCSVHLLELFNGGSDGGCEEETSLGDVTEMAVLQEGSVPERDGREGEREGERGREREREGERGREREREGGGASKNFGTEKQLRGAKILSSTCE